ncbi:glucose 1-dehydrogenase 2-like [Pectinophora gossypiella]|uniref:glucose 1-dehydrogenase 2-like n=1 Tax=Pectinophora gossypiella TaxID=13191 RepID=UPI00214F1906|nr:glucose 1-dehydrogenase 2-like [Pectinophora gossypiella]
MFCCSRNKSNSLSSRVNMSLKNKVAIVTGGSSGIGAAIAVAFTAEGAKVAIVARNETKLAEVAKECEKNGAEPLVIVADVSKEDDAQKIIETTLKKFGKLDILVNNAGIARSGSILDKDSLAKFDQVLATNLRSVVYLTHLAAPHIIETKGNIINMSSVAAIGVFAPNTFIYNTSKAALDHFTRCIALELAPKGVRVNNINPGPVKSDIVANTGADPAMQAMSWEMMKGKTALKRIGDPEEIADLAVFIASDKGRSITGSSIVSDNGTLLQ